MNTLLRLVIAAFAIGLTGIGAAENPPRGFFVKLIPSKAVNIGDQFIGILPERPPHFPVTTQAVCGEKFTVNVIFSGAEIRDGKIALAGMLTMTDPAGKETKIPWTEEQTDIRGDKAGAFLTRHMTMVIFEPQDPKGAYRFEVELADRNTARTAKDTAQVRYVSEIKPDDKTKAWDKIDHYYLSPCPEYIVPAFQEYLAGLPQQKTREGRNFNPLPQLAFFYFLLKENPQCAGAFADKVKSLKGEEELFGAIILYFAVPEMPDLLNAEQKAEVKHVFPANPFEFPEAKLPWQLDVCWAEFLVRGTKAPVMKVLNSMALTKDSMTVEEFKKLAKPTPEDRRKLFNGLTVTAACWSTGSLAKKHHLLRWYIEAALIRGEIKDPITAVLAARAIGMKVKTTPPKP
ncbi:MAG: hypothetical protein MR051_08760 [Lentisphaeria bacterium]|nr:hypothetical protein [Lentisphaeria bacterium]